MSSKEKRRTNRKLISLRASVMRTDTVGVAQPMPVKTLDLSNKGALIESPDCLFQDEVCTFNLVTDTARSVEVLGRVAWVDTKENGICRAGVAFRNLSPDEEYLLDLQLVRAR